MKTVIMILSVVCFCEFGIIPQLGFGTCCGAGKKTTLMPGDSITLQWCPTDSIDKAAISPLEKCACGIVLNSVADSRPDKAYLGKNAEGKAEKKVYLKTDLASWFKNRLDSCFSQKCSTVLKEDVYQVSVAVDRFDITESGMYRCSLEVEIDLKGLDSVSLVREKILSAADVWGRSFNEKKYSSVSSNGVIQLANTILGLEPFRKYKKAPPQKVK